MASLSPLDNTMFFADVGMIASMRKRKLTIIFASIQESVHLAQRGRYDAIGRLGHFYFAANDFSEFRCEWSGELSACFVKQIGLDERTDGHAYMIILIYMHALHV